MQLIYLRPLDLRPLDLRPLDLRLAAERRRAAEERRLRRRAAERLPLARRRTNLVLADLDKRLFLVGDPARAQLEPSSNLAKSYLNGLLLYLRSRTTFLFAPHMSRPIAMARPREVL